MIAYIPSTKKLYTDPDFCIFFYPRENGVGFASVLRIYLYPALTDCILILILIYFLSSRNGVELTSFL